MDSCLVLKIVGVSTYSGAIPGDYVQVGISTRKGVYGAELIVAVEKIIPAAEIENNWK